MSSLDVQQGFACVYFDAKEATKRANGMELGGHRITVDFSITKRPHTPTPGICMGDLPVAALAVGITVAEGRMEALMIGTIIAEHPEEEVEGKAESRSRQGLDMQRMVASSLL